MRGQRWINIPLENIHSHLGMPSGDCLRPLSFQIYGKRWSNLRGGLTVPRELARRDPRRRQDSRYSCKKRRNRKGASVTLDQRITRG
jgi:hypothetical protein